MSTDLITNDDDSGALARADQSAMAMATTRQAQEVQAAMIIAKRFPRDEMAAVSRIKRACARPGLAEQAQYSFPRGGSKVTGPSIRLAESLAQNWGNIDYGIIELEQKPGESVCMAYCWDLETNTRVTKVFAVSHKRATRQGTTLLTDPRDIYEMVANNGARRVRACILGVIPGDIVDMAETECEKTLLGKNDKPLADRVREMVLAFERFSVTREMIEKRLGHNIDATSIQEVVALQKVYTSLKDGQATREQFFDVAPLQGEGEQPKSRTEAAKKKTTPPVTFEQMQDKAMNVQSLADVAAVRSEVCSSTLPVEQQNELCVLLDQAADQFSTGG